MPIKKSATKELRKSKKRTIVNVSKKRAIKDLIKKIRKSVDEEKIDEAKKLAQTAVKLLDKAAKTKLMHKNTAARKKSRIYKSISRKSQPKQ